MKNSGQPDCIQDTGFIEHRLKSRWAVLFLLTAMGSCFIESAEAKELFLQPTFSTRVEYDDNIRLATDSGIEKSAYGIITRAGGVIGARSDLYNILLNNNFEIKRYDSDFELDSENIFIDLTSNYSVTQRNQFSLNGNYTRDTTLTSELEVTGLVQNNIIREAWSISPAWTYFLSDTQYLQAGYNHYEVMYEESGRFFDFNTDMITLTYGNQWTELLSSYLSVSAMRFEVPDIGRDTTEYTVSVGGDYQFLPTWTLGMSVGGRFTSTDINSGGITVTDDAEGIVFSFDLKKKFDTGSANINYSRSTSAQGNGRQRLIDRFIVRYNRKMTQNIGIALVGGINYTTTSGSGDFNGDEDRTYYHFTPSINWLIDENATLNAGYRYRMQEFDSNRNSATSNSVFLSFSYQWDKIRTQRY